MSEDINVGSETSNEISPEVEREAKLLGWVPKEQYRGNPDEWRDADEFLEFGKKLNPILRKNNEALLKRLEARERELDEIRSTVSEFAKFHKETEERAYKRALEELKQQKKVALEEGDYDAVTELDDQIADIKAAAKEPSKAKEPRNAEEQAAHNQKVYKEWESANSWVKDPEVAKKAQVVGYELRLNGDTTIDHEFLDHVADAMKEKYPELFGNTNRDKSLVEGGSPSSVSGKKGKSYNDLPADAKRECDKFVKQGLLTKEQYVADYFED
jgi:DNA repair exonuclease SbcCD ATPase subunit